MVKTVCEERYLIFSRSTTTKRFSGKRKIFYTPQIKHIHIHMLYTINNTYISYEIRNVCYTMTALRISSGIFSLLMTP